MAMDVLASWSAQTALDPVDGRYFPVPAFFADNIEAELVPHIMSLASDRHTEIAEHAIALFSGMKATEEGIASAAAAILADSTPIPLRFAWFRWLQKQRPEGAGEVAVTALTGTKHGLSMTATNHLLDRGLKTNEVREYVMQTLNSSQNTRQLQGGT